MFRRIDTVFLPVRNLEQAIAWYTGTFGFTLRWRDGNYAAINVAETPLTIYQPEGEFRPLSEHAPFNFFAPDVDAAHARLGEHGAQVDEVTRMTGFVFFDFRDPDGNRLSVCSFPEK